MTQARDDWSFEPLDIDSNWTWNEAVDYIQTYYEKRIAVVRDERELWRRMCLQAEKRIKLS